VPISKVWMDGLFSPCEESDVLARGLNQDRPCIHLDRLNGVLSG